MDEGQYDSTEECFWATGAALFVRNKVFKSLGGFDEDYFAHMEEIDLCWRMKAAGFKVMTCPESVVYHVGGGTLNYQSPFKTYLNFRNSLYTIFKNEPKQKLFWLIPLRLILDAIAGLLFLVEGKFSHIKAIVKAHWNFFPEYKNLRKKRAHYQDLVQKFSIAPPRTKIGRLSKSIVLRYYLKGSRKFSQLSVNPSISSSS